MLCCSLGYDKQSTTAGAKSRYFRPIIHRDIKPENILLSYPRHGRHATMEAEDCLYPSIVLADFGLSVLHHDGWCVGTDMWQPPETPYHSAKSDVWSVGAIVHALAAHGQPPIGPLPAYMEDISANWDWWYQQPEARQPYAYFEKFTYKLAAVMHLALVRDPVRRPTSLEILLKVEREMEAPEFPWRGTQREPIDERVLDLEGPS